jgi:ribosome-associated protein
VAESKPSKSARKREHLALQVLGEQLVELKESELRTIPLDERLLDAILVAQRVSAHGALRRQKQLIGKLMGHVDPEPVRAALAALSADSRQDKMLFARAERWRDRLCDEGSGATEEFLSATGDGDGILRQLVADLSSAPNEQIARKLRRQIFRQVHDLLAARPHDV